MDLLLPLLLLLVQEMPPGCYFLPNRIDEITEIPPVQGLPVLVVELGLRVSLSSGIQLAGNLSMPLSFP